MVSVYGVALLLALVLNAAANLLMKVGATRVQTAGGLLHDGLPAAAIKVLTSPVLVIPSWSAADMPSSPSSATTSWASI